jgi:hypothetical protein
MNYEHFDKVNFYLVCGFNQHIDENSRKCIDNAQGFYTLTLPNFKFGFKTKLSSGKTCSLSPEQKMNLDHIERSKLEFICAYMTRLEYQQRVELAESISEMKENDGEKKDIFE